MREQNTAVITGFYKNKQHPNTVLLGKDLSNKSILDLVQHSYDFAFQSPPKRIKYSIIFP